MFQKTKPDSVGALPGFLPFCLMERLMTEMDLTLDRLKKVLSYDRTTGVFYWRVSTSNRVKAGRMAGRDNGVGYLRLMLDRRLYYTHRLAWMYVHGTMPEVEIDHINGNRSDNRISNLRLAQHRENGQNQALRKTNTSGKHGVSWSKPHNKWAAYIMKDGRKRHLGLFDSLEDAGDAYLAGKARLHQFQPVPRDL